MGIGQTNCLTEIFIDRALKRAARLDEYFKKTGKTMGPLHGMDFYRWLIAILSQRGMFLCLGLPISLKDQINIEGVESTMGKISSRLPLWRQS